MAVYSYSTCIRDVYSQENKFLGRELKFAGLLWDSNQECKIIDLIEDGCCQLSIRDSNWLTFMQ